MGWHAPPEELTLSNPLWNLALDLWQQHDFASACLEAQSGGVAVTHILVALHTAGAGFTWAGHEPDGIRQWREESTEKLRGLRQSLQKGNPSVAAFRQQVADCELASEQVELAWWWQFLGTMDSGLAHSDLHPAEQARHNLVSIGLDGELAPVRHRIVDAWKQTPEQDQPTGNRE